MIKMIVIDLDGTVLNSDGKLLKDTKKYLKELKDKGYIIVIATGRIYASSLYATDGAEFANYIISDTGSCCFDLKTSDSIFINTIEKKDAMKIFKYYNDDCRYIKICDKNIIYKYSDEVDEYFFTKTTKDFNYILNNCEYISHISIGMKNNSEVNNLSKILKENIQELGIEVLQDSFSNVKWIEIMPKGCSKYNAIKILSKYLNINNDEIIAFGDSLNDIEMLKKCGQGVALKNALQEVKDAADEVTIYDHNNDGVIKYLKSYLN